MALKSSNYSNRYAYFNAFSLERTLILRKLNLTVIRLVAQTGIMTNGHGLPASKPYHYHFWLFFLLIIKFVSTQSSLTVVLFFRI